MWNNINTDNKLLDAILKDVEHEVNAFLLIYRSKWLIICKLMPIRAPTDFASGLRAG